MNNNVSPRELCPDLFSLESIEDNKKLAISQLNGKNLDFGDLAQIVKQLHTVDLFYGKRVGVFISDRLLAGLVSLGVMAVGVCVPINVKLTDDEVLSLLQELAIDVVITDRILFRTRANVLEGVTSLEVRWRGKLIDFSEWKVQETETGEAKGLLLLTSGSTGKPKPILLSLENLRHGVEAIASSVQLTSEDVVLNVLPMMHIGGLIDLLLVPLSRGGQVVFAEPAELATMAEQIDDKGLTWLQGSPTLLAEMKQHLEPSVHLRFVRSVSAPLAENELEALEHHFKVPVVEMYGMSETSGVITSNPVSRRRKVGSVGLPIRAEIELALDGEILVKSDGVFEGGKCEDGWLKTGDLGYLDEEGFLFLTGRKKEVINRGGQKVYPLEVDQVLGAWPEVREVATFAQAHSSLGEEVAVAIVLEEGAELSEREIRQKCALVLANYKCPKMIYFVDKLPRNVSGKLLRLELPSRVKRELESKGNGSEVCQKICALVASILDEDEVCVRDDFFEIGGDSLSAVALISAVEKEWKISIDEFVFFESPRIQEIALFVEARLDKRKGKKGDGGRGGLARGVEKRLRKFLQTWDGVPMFRGAYAIGSRNPQNLPTLFWCCNAADELDAMRQACRGVYEIVVFRTLRKVQHKWLRNNERLCRLYADQIKRIQPNGKIAIGGYCEGARLMMRVAELLRAEGREMSHVVVHDYAIKKAVSCYVSMIYSSGWDGSPLRRYVDVRKGWELLYRRGYGCFELEGTHHNFSSESWVNEIRSFMQQEREELKGASLTTLEEHSATLRIQLYQSLPRVIKKGVMYSVTGIVRNVDSKKWVNQGQVVHARWVDLAGDIKFDQKMCMELPEVIEPGESVDFSLKVVGHKKKRIYRLDIAVVIEGYNWIEKITKWILIK